MLPKIGLALLGLLLLLAAAQVLAAVRFKAFATELMAKVAGAPGPVAGIDDLPPAILRFAARSGVQPGNLARTIHLTQTAEMQVVKGGDWAALEARQVISTGTAGFVWLAVQPMGPLVKFRVIDALTDGQGRLDARALGSIPVAKAVGPETDIAEAMRYLAELVWAPDAMLGNPDLRWQDNPDGTVAVRLEMPAGTAEVQYVFDTHGDIIQVLAKDRPAETIDGQIQTHDWRITIDAYQEYGARRTASHAEVGYVYEDGYQAYWRGIITTYEASP